MDPRVGGPGEVAGAKLAAPLQQQLAAHVSILPNSPESLLVQSEGEAAQVDEGVAEGVRVLLDRSQPGERPSSEVMPVPQKEYSLITVT